MKIIILIACIYVSNAELNNTVTISNGADFFLFWESSLVEVNKSNQFPDAISDLIGDLPESDYWYFYNQIGIGDILTRPLNVTDAAFLCIQMKFFIINVDIYPLFGTIVDPITNNSTAGILNTFEDCIAEDLEYGFLFQITPYPPLNIFILQEIIMWSDGPNFPNYPHSTTTNIPSTGMTTNSSTGSTTTTPTTTPTTTTLTTTTPTTTMTPTTRTPTTTTMTPTTTKPPIFRCPSAGKFADPNDCMKYFQCILSGTTYLVFQYTCSPNTHWDQSILLCYQGPCPATTTTVMTTTAVATTTTSVPTTARTTTTTDISIELCTAEGKFANSANPCHKYYQCLLISGTWVKYDYTCPNGTTWSQSLNLCTPEPCKLLSTTQVPIITTTAPSFVCNAAGKFADPSDCTKYYQCLLISGSWLSYSYTCPSGINWSQSSQLCLEGPCETSNATTTTAGTTTTTTARTTTAASFVCSSAGKFADPSDCTKYYQCLLISGSWVSYSYTCPSGINWSQSSQLCVEGPCETSGTRTTTAGTTTTTTARTTTTAGTTTTARITTPAPFVCSSAGKFADLSDCTKYYHCVLFSGDLVAFNYTCPPGTNWSQSLKLCVRGPCETSNTTTTTDSKFTTTAGAGTTTPSPFVCSSAGKFVDPSDCTKYNQCLLINGNLVAYSYTCPSGTNWSQLSQLCVEGLCEISNTTTN